MGLVSSKPPPSKDEGGAPRSSVRVDGILCGRGTLFRFRRCGGDIGESKFVMVTRMRQGWLGGLGVVAICAAFASVGRAREQGAPDAKAPVGTELREPDARYKVDILLVVAHPDDEGAATAYLARAIDEGKRVAVVYGTRGNSGGNEVGMEQASALAAIREIEARPSLSLLGIENVWFLNGKDTASQNVLNSLSTWNHGEALQQLVRLVRLTRPEVILTFMPGTFVGEDHGDHQAAGVLATEAFDLSG